MNVEDVYTRGIYIKKKKKAKHILAIKKKMLGEAVFPLKGQGFFKEGKKQPKKKKRPRQVKTATSNQTKNS